MGAVMLWGWDDENDVWRKVWVDSDGKLLISDADPFEIVQDTPQDLTHVPHGRVAGDGVYLPFQVDAAGILQVAIAALASLGLITDVNLAGIADGDVIIWDAAAEEWIVKTFGERYTDAEAVGAVEAAGLTLDALKHIVFANDGKIVLGALDGSPELFGGWASDPTNVWIRPKDGNRAGGFGILPKGTQDMAYIRLGNDEDRENYGHVFLSIDGVNVSLQGAKTGTGTIPNLFLIEFDTVPYSTVTQGLGNATYWWKHIKAKGVHAESDFADHGFAGDVTVDLLAGENLAFGDAVYLKSDGKAWKADADLATTMPIFAMVVATTIDAEAAGELLTRGWIRDEHFALTAGGLVYASVTAGAIHNAVPVGDGDQVQVIGVAKTTKTFFFNPSFELVEVSA